MRRAAALALFTLACSGGKSIVLVEVSAGDPGIALSSVDISATPKSGSAVLRHFDWNSASGPLAAGIYLPGSVEGEVTVQATGTDAVGMVAAMNTTTVKPGQVSERVALALKRVGPGPIPPDGGAPPPDGGAPPPEAGPPPPDGPGAETSAPPDTAPPADVAPIDPPSLTRCTVYEHGPACTLGPTTLGIGVWDLVFSPDGKYLLTGGGDGRVKIWQVTPTGLVDDNRAFMGGPDKSSVHLAFSADGTRLAVGGGDGTIGLFEFPKLTRLAALTGHISGVTFLAFSRDGSKLVSIDNLNALKIWNVAAAKEQRGLVLPNDWSTAALSPAGQPASLWLAVSYTGMNGFAMMDLATDPSPMYTAATSHPVYVLAFSPDGQTLAVSGEDPEPSLTVWDVSNKQKPVAGPALLQNAAGSTSAPVAGVFSADGRFLATGGSRGEFGAGDIRIFRVQPPGLFGSVATDSSSVSLDFTRDGRGVAVGAWRCGKITYCRD